MERIVPLGGGVGGTLVANLVSRKLKQRIHAGHASVTVVEYPRGTSRDPSPSHSLVINGKSDGDTILDYSTITLAAMLPYFHAPDRPDLRAAVVGLGTGVTAGVLDGPENSELQRPNRPALSSLSLESTSPRLPPLVCGSRAWGALKAIRKTAPGRAMV